MYKYHPRRCGENRPVFFLPNKQIGSPPQVRGKLTEKHCFITMRRITPAGAGKTSNIALNVALFRDHPRRCGENGTALYSMGSKTGSPPQVRGKQIPACWIERNHGITPAGAGKTQPTTIYSNATKDHPRRCGENDILPSTFKQSLGSPPQVRGKHTTAFLFLLGVRITPAGAGKTTSPPSRFRLTEDHPRRCGENVPTARKSCRTGRITPAGAGKTVHTRSCNPPSKDHPRRCGENTRIPFARSVKLGSPPQVRGKHTKFLMWWISRGITPAGAGKTMFPCSKLYIIKDHPRRCGENL